MEIIREANLRFARREIDAKDVESASLITKLGVTAVCVCVRICQTKPNYLHGTVAWGGGGQPYSFPQLHSRSMLFLRSRVLSKPDRIWVIAKCGIARAVHSTFSQLQEQPAPSCIGQIEFILFEGVPQIEQRSNDFPFSLRGVYGVFMGRTCLPATRGTLPHATYMYNVSVRACACVCAACRSDIDTINRASLRLFRHPYPPSDFCARR